MKEDNTIELGRGREAMTRSCIEEASFDVPTSGIIAVDVIHLLLNPQHAVECPPHCLSLSNYQVSMPQVGG